MGVLALGYVVVETAKPQDWDRFLSQFAGLMRVADSADGAALYRADDRVFRFRIQPGAEERLVAAAYQLGSSAELASIAEKLQSAGRPIRNGTADEAKARGVEGFLATSDPAGNGLEFYWGDARTAEPFVSPIGVPGFITGALGLGHAVFSAPNFAETHAFYRDVIGLHDTDLPVFHLMGPDGPPMRFAFMHADNGRHHSLALGEGPSPPSGCIHLMLELPSLTDVGKAYDRMKAFGYPESATLGEHVNDQMTSFYVQTPSGFDLEIGFNGLVIDPASWQVTRHAEISVWGHVWAWQEAMKKRAAE
jgi:3,4-dihydroxy-9,10-secoandrosta-1,3,5(10)-triene-9,17-dione 4,5-dioxygenase